MKKLFSLVLMLVSSALMWAGEPSDVGSNPASVNVIQSASDFDYDLEKVPWMVGKWKAKTTFGSESFTFNSNGTFTVSLSMSNRDSKQNLSVTMSIGGTYGYSPDYAAVVCVYDTDTYNTKVNACKGFTKAEIDEFSEAMKENFMEEETFMLYPMSHSSSRMSFRDSEGAVMTFTKASSGSKK